MGLSLAPKPPLLKLFGVQLTHNLWVVFCATHISTKHTKSYLYYEVPFSAARCRRRIDKNGNCKAEPKITTWYILLIQVHQQNNNIENILFKLNDLLCFLPCIYWTFRCSKATKSVFIEYLFFCEQFGKDQVCFTLPLAKYAHWGKRMPFFIYRRPLVGVIYPSLQI